jgi:integrase
MQRDGTAETPENASSGAPAQVRGTRPKRRKARRPRGIGQVIKRGGVWGVRWRENGRRRFKGGFPDENTAARVLARILVDVAEGRPAGAPDAKNLPALAELAKDWLERRERAGVIRSWRDDRNRWTKHLKPAFGACKPPEVTAATIRRFIERKLAEKLSSTSVRHCVATLSNLFSDVIEQGYASSNPARALPRSTRRLIRNAHDPKTTPFLERQDDVRRVFLALEQPFATLYALGALGGLRPGEALAVEWSDVDLGASRLLVQRQVRHGRVGPPKNGKPRVVPLIPALVKVLAEFKLATGGGGRLFPSKTPARGGARGTPGKYLDPAVMQRKLGDVLKGCGLPAMSLYSAGRHTYGAQHVLGGGSLATLREILGHSSVVVTERYGHLRPDLFRPTDLLQLSVDLSRPGGELVDLAAARDERRARAADEPGAAQPALTATP